MDVDLFDFKLPEERIALRPASPRDSARMLVIFPDGRMEHRHVRDLPIFLRSGDALVLNDTKVIPARLRGVRLRRDTEAKVEILLHHHLGSRRYKALARPAKKLDLGDKLVFGEIRASVIARGEAGEIEIEFEKSDAALEAAIEVLGEMPLPPYIANKRAADARDAHDYQTVYARQRGSIAAPTAGLHFTTPLLAELEAKGVNREAITLHVGLGTFLPVVAHDTESHRMHAEQVEIAEDAAARLNRVHAQGGRVVAVGTTSLRALESAVDENGQLHGLLSETDIFITPGYRFRAADMLLTNFHLPRSTLFMLVSAFMGLDVMRNAYEQAVAMRYRFYSYGDACLLIRSP